ncbi:MAG TPA: alpha-xylosidase [Microbacteriaceae bacterium]|nr:alpha-xylosidase [Microbacteriaceae bacterium]
MKFTDGYWQLRDGVSARYARETYAVEPAEEGGVVALAVTKHIASRGDTLNTPTLTVTVTSPLPDVIGVRVEHFARHLGRGFALAKTHPPVSVEVSPEAAVVRSGRLQARLGVTGPWDLTFSAEGERLTAAAERSLAYVEVAPGKTAEEIGVMGPGRLAADPALPRHYVCAQLSLGVGELVYGLGERFGPLVKNGQSVDIWNADGGTSSEQAYKNVPFYLTNRGYGVFVNDSGPVSYEIGSEATERVQFSVPGESLEYFVIYGPGPKEILERYTALTGRPAVVPAWSYGLWLSTSFTTRYDEETVTKFVDQMAKRRIPLSVFHFDCFWMREFAWCDFEWDPRTFPDPEGMLERLHAKDLHVCVWINPYIGQRSALFAEAADAGYLLRRPDGSVWQWDRWQAGMALVDFTNPAAVSWYQSKLRRLIGQGVDAFKTDFGERVPLDVRYADGSDPALMHNRYTELYNSAVHEVLTQERGEAGAVLFARSATAGGQRHPVHWGGDSTSTFESMAETLRGGLSLAFSGFSFWSHDIGGFEGTPDPAVFKRWLAFGLLSSHSRLHGSDSYRVPWAFDAGPSAEADPQSAVSVARKFARLKNRLMPYLFAAGWQAHERGIPVLRPLQMEFPGDPAVDYLDRQYMLGPDLLVAPVFDAPGRVTFYLPGGRWTSLLTGSVVEGGSWRTETHGYDSLPLYLRPGALLPLGARADRPDYDYLDGLEFVVARSPRGETTSEVEILTPSGRRGVFRATRSATSVRIDGDVERGWGARWAGDERAARAERGSVTLTA